MHWTLRDGRIFHLPEGQRPADADLVGAVWVPLVPDIDEPADTGGLMYIEPPFLDVK
jgi:hypothetical protein